MGTRTQRKKALKEGDVVRVHIPDTGIDTGDTITRKLQKRYNGLITTIARKKSFATRQSYYELEDIVSEKGIPYAFMRDWLQEVHDDDDAGV